MPDKQGPDNGGSTVQVFEPYLLIISNESTQILDVLVGVSSGYTFLHLPLFYMQH